MQKHKFLIDVNYRRDSVKKLAIKHGWLIADEDSRALILFKDDYSKSKNGKVKLIFNFYFRSLITELDHPKKGLTKLQRFDIDGDIIEKILIDVRKHTNLKTKYHKR